MILTDIKGTSCLASLIIFCGFHMMTIYETPVWRTYGPLGKNVIYSSQDPF